ncbi:C25 family cysteine peptidase [candidate division KSB1 bacterium]
MKRKKLSLIFVLFIITISFAICKNSTDSISNPYLNKPGIDPTGNKMLIISTPEYETALSDFINWKRQRGLDVELDVSLAGEGVNAVKNKIREKYNNGGLTYIILVGDIDDVPSPYFGGSPSDPSYVLLEGDDLVGDALISRISVNNVSELENQVGKIMYYEKGEFESYDWINQALVASMDGFDGIDHANTVENALKEHPEYFTKVLKIMESDGGITEKIRDAIEKTGVNFIAHHGHGSTTAFGSLPFSREDASKLKNTGKGLPIIHGAACSTGSFWITNGDCLAEAFMKAGTASEPAGAIAFLGGSASMDPYACIAAQKEVYTKLYFEEENDTVGILFYKGTLNAMKTLSEDSAERLYKYWHLFGDCSMRLWKTPPAGN